MHVGTAIGCDTGMADEAGGWWEEGKGSYFSKIMIWSSRGRGGERMIFQELRVVLMDSRSEKLSSQS